MVMRHRFLFLMSPLCLSRLTLPSCLKYFVHSRRFTMPSTHSGFGDSEARPNAYVEQIVDGISAITLDRPKQKNAISVKLLGELKASIEQAADDQRRVSL